MTEKNDNGGIEQLPQVAADYIELVLRKMKYSRKVRAEVRTELVDHFLQAVKDCDNEDDKVECAKELITDFGDAVILGKLMRRGKKRCRPLWKKIVSGSLAVVGVVLLICLLRIGHLAVGSPSISVDYVAWLNNLTSDGKNESLNARPDYERAVELLVEIPESLKSVYDGEAEFEELNIDEVKSYLDAMAPSFEAVRAGAKKTYYWPNYSVKSEITSTEQFTNEVVESQMGFFGPTKKLAMIWNYYQLPWDMSNGNIESALQDCIAFKRLAQHLSGRGLLIEQLVGIAIEGLAMASIETVLRSEQLNSKQLAWLQKEIERTVDGHDHPVNMEAEKALLLDYVQRGFTDDGKGNGRVLLKGLPLITKDIKSDVSGFLLLNYPDRRETTASIEALHAGIDMIIHTPPFQSNSNEIEVFESSFLTNAGNLMWIDYKAISKVGQMSWRLLTNRQALAVICAIFRYEDQYDKLPGSLGDLVDAGFIDEVPIDPYSGEPFVYRAADGDFILYSVGENMIDDGGVYGTNGNRGKKRRYSDNGDFVCWPVED